MLELEVYFIGFIFLLIEIVDMFRNIDKRNLGVKFSFSYRYLTLFRGDFLKLIVHSTQNVYFVLSEILIMIPYRLIHIWRNNYGK